MLCIPDKKFEYRNSIKTTYSVDINNSKNMANILIIDKIKKALAFSKDFFILCCLFFKTKNYFFFPTYQTGGSERVHLDIIKATRKKNIVFFFNESLNKHYYKEFSKKATLLKCINTKTISTLCLCL